MDDHENTLVMEITVKQETDEDFDVIKEPMQIVDIKQEPTEMKDEDGEEDDLIGGSIITVRYDHVIVKTKEGKMQPITTEVLTTKTNMDSLEGSRERIVLSDTSIDSDGITSQSLTIPDPFKVATQNDTLENSFGDTSARSALNENLLHTLAQIDVLHNATEVPSIINPSEDTLLPKDLCCDSKRGEEIDGNTPDPCILCQQSTLGQESSSKLRYLLSVKETCDYKDFLKKFEKQSPRNQDLQSNVEEQLKRNKSFKEETKLLRYRQKHVKDSEVINTDETPFKCKQCPRSFENQKLLKSHRRTGTCGKIYKCRYCVNTYKYKRSRRNHERMHTGENLRQCKLCLKHFTTPGELKAHEGTHTGVKPYKCKYCPRSFGRPSYLRDHETIHTGENRIQCKLCDKTFIHADQMKNHEMVHTGERPFHCKFCSKSFILESTMRAHERVHTQEAPYKCKYCPRKFFKSVDAENHERWHTGEKPFNCNHCDKTFGSVTNLKRHERRHKRFIASIPEEYRDLF